MAHTTGGKRLSPGRETSEKILRAAERLFAERGINGVSLREINRAAGQANRSAVQYYFGDRNGLVRAIIARHSDHTEGRRHALLDEYEVRAAGAEEPGADLDRLVEAFLDPLVAKLGDPDGGREYLRICAEFYARPRPFEELFPEPRPDHSMFRWHRLLDPLVPAEERTDLHSRFPAIRFAFVELSRRAAAPPHRDDELFASHLLDLVTAVLTSRPSARTAQLLERRSRP